MTDSIPFEIDVETYRDMLDKEAPHFLLDIREPWELAVCKLDNHGHIPMGQIPYSVDQLPRDKDLVIYCHHGVRSLKVMAWLRHNGFERATSLRGGVQAWADRIDPGMARY